jgi:hypothetical protein
MVGGHIAVLCNGSASDGDKLRSAVSDALERNATLELVGVVPGMRWPLGVCIAYGVNAVPTTPQWEAALNARIASFVALLPASLSVKSWVTRDPERQVRRRLTQRCPHVDLR